MATKVAIIEDDAAIAQMYRMKFEADGFIVETAENGALGLELVQEILVPILTEAATLQGDCLVFGNSQLKRVDHRNTY